jgi:hypothetical protein
MQYKYRINLSISVKRAKKFPLETDVFKLSYSLALWNILDSLTPLLNIRRQMPMPPPILKFVLQVTISANKPPTTAPKTPIVAISAVPYPLLSLDNVSATREIQPPSSPARPTPAIKRQIAYGAKLSTKLFAIFAIEYRRIEPKSVAFLPILSPKTPKTMPPISIPVICHDMRSWYQSPFFMIYPSPNSFRLYSRTFIKRERSYMSTKYPRPPTITAG